MGNGIRGIQRECLATVLLSVEPAHPIYAHAAEARVGFLDRGIEGE